jgi:hypothetical protein
VVTPLFPGVSGSRSTNRVRVSKVCGHAGNREEQRVLAGDWHDHTLGAIPFRQYVENDWLPSKHIEATTRAAYASYLNRHFFPFFGKKLLSQITPPIAPMTTNQDMKRSTIAGVLPHHGRVTAARMTPLGCARRRDTHR